MLTDPAMRTAHQDTAHLDRAVLRERLKAVRPVETGERVQKNLTVLRTDAARLASLAAREATSQARILALALDCYEQAYGPLATTDPEPTP